MASIGDEIARLRSRLPLTEWSSACRSVAVSSKPKLWKFASPKRQSFSASLPKCSRWDLSGMPPSGKPYRLRPHAKFASACGWIKQRKIATCFGDYRATALACRAIMKDYLASIEKLRRDAAEYALIRDLATDQTKREMYDRLYRHLIGLAHEVEQAMQSPKAG